MYNLTNDPLLHLRDIAMEAVHGVIGVDMHGCVVFIGKNKCDFSVTLNGKTYLVDIRELGER